MHDADHRQAMAITLFEDEEAYRRGDETLESMSPPDPGMGRRVGVDRYEVDVQLEA